jgi:hypothetical protein
MYISKKIESLLKSENFNKIDINKFVDSNMDIDIDNFKINNVFKNNFKKCNECTECKEYMIENIHEDGIIITNPGTYYFANNIVWTPSKNYQIAISIQCNNVVINLKNYILECNNPNNYDVIGIYSNVVSNISIINGEVKNMCRYGISLNETTNIVLDKIFINGLTIVNLDIRNLTPAGIFCNKCSDITINKCSIENIYVTSDSSAGIQLSYSQLATVSNCYIYNMINNDGAAQGISYFLSEDITTNYCVIDRIQTFFNGNILTTGHTVLGICPFLSSNLIFDNMRITNMIGCCDDCHGVSLFIVSSILFKNSYISNVIDGFGTNTGAKATGIEVYGSDIEIDNCIVENVKAINPQDKICSGFSCAGDYIKFNNCISKNVIVVNEFGETDIKNIGFGTGFGWAPDPRIEFRYIYSYNINYTKCISYNCQTGFDTWNHIESTWKDITSYNCDNNILIQTNGSRSISCNCCSECNPPINIVLFNNASNNIINNSVNIENV